MLGEWQASGAGVEPLRLLEGDPVLHLKCKEIDEASYLLPSYFVLPTSYFLLTLASTRPPMT